MIQQLNNSNSTVEKVEKFFKNIEVITSDSILTRERLERLIEKIYIFYPKEIKEAFKAEMSEQEWEKLYNEGGIFIKFNVG